MIRGILPILDAGQLAGQGLFSDIPSDPASGLGVPPGLDEAGRHAAAERIARFLGGTAVSSVQLRCKGPPEEAHHFIGIWLQALRTHSPHMAVIVNDHVELAKTLEADGVHVGQDDTPVAVCRHILGPTKLIGLSTHTMEEVRAANGQAGLDYIGFGPVFPTHSKQDAASVQGVDNLAKACRVARMPVVAIGGIQHPQLEAVHRAGATSAAMIGGLWERTRWAHLLEQAERRWYA